MAFVKVASLAQFPSGSLLQVEVNDDSYAICNNAGELQALEGICPHAGGPLGQGALHDGIVVCPWHAWEFDSRSGQCTHADGYSVTKFPIKAEGDDILIDVP